MTIIEFSIYKKATSFDVVYGFEVIWTDGKNAPYTASGTAPSFEKAYAAAMACVYGTKEAK